MSKDGAPFDPIELYAAAIDTSDYVGRVAPLVRRHVPAIGDLLDVGAGGGQLGRALRNPACRWTALDPTESMRSRLARYGGELELVPSGWAEADVDPHSHDTVLAANIAPPLQQPEEFLAHCRRWTRAAIVWVVPAQHGPHGLVFAGCLPAAWHGEDETPGIDIVLRKLPKISHPDVIEFADWTFSAYVPDLPALAAYLANRLGWADKDHRRPALLDHLARQAVRDAIGIRLDIPRRSAVLIWTPRASTTAR
jgi:SAM-dependent methyltransferase